MHRRPARRSPPTRLPGRRRCTHGINQEVGPKAQWVKRAVDDCAKARDRLGRQQSERQRIENSTVALDGARTNCQGLRPAPGRTTSNSCPDGVRTTVRDTSGRSGSRNDGRKCDRSERSRIVSQGKPLRTIPSRTKAQRRSPARPCQETSTFERDSAPIDLTGYRHKALTRPTSTPRRDGVDDKLKQGTITTSVLGRAPLRLEEVERGELKPAAAPLDWLFEFKLAPPHAFVQVVAREARGGLKDRLGSPTAP